MSTMLPFRYHCGNDLEEGGRVLAREREIAELVNDQKSGSCKEAASWSPSRLRWRRDSVRREIPVAV